MFPRSQIKKDKVGVICSKRCDKREIHTKFMLEVNSARYQLGDSQCTWNNNIKI